MSEGFIAHIARSVIVRVDLESGGVAPISEVEDALGAWTLLDTDGSARPRCLCTGHTHAWTCVQVCFCKQQPMATKAASLSTAKMRVLKKV